MLNNFFSCIKENDKFKYALHNLSNESEEKCKLIAIMDCEVLIDYGDKIEKVKLFENNEIRWNNNVVILNNNKDYYKSTVSAEQLIVISKTDSLKKIPYITPENEIVFCGGWYDM